MAGLNPSARSLPIPAPREPRAHVTVPRILMSWEDWLTFAAVVVAFSAIAISIQQSDWVDSMPPLVPTVLAGLVVGLVAARLRFHALLLQPPALLLGLVVVVAMVQTFATGETVADRVVDVRDRLQEWWAIARAGDISNDDLPFVFMVHGLAWLAAYFACWTIFRWHNAWLALIPGAFVLLSNISFQDNQPAAAFIVFLLAAMVIVARTHLQHRQAEWRRARVPYPDFMSLNALVAALLASCVLVLAAWQVPLAAEQRAAERIVEVVTEPFEPLHDDVVRLFNAVSGAGGGNFHSFGETLIIRGDVEISPSRLFEVQAAQPGLVRATSYDRYTGVGWQATDRESRRAEGLEFLDEAREPYHDRQETVLQVRLLDSESTLLSLGIPLGTNLSAFIDTPEGAATDIERLRSSRALDRGDTYNVVGSVSVASSDALRSAGTSYPAWVADRYLQLPDDLPQSVRDEAARIAASADNPYDAALAIQDYLRTLPYSFDVPAAPPGQDVVEYLLFDTRQGYFDYQATAMAVMLRTLDVPARIAVGFALEPSSFEDGAFVVRKDHAFAWVEVFFPEYGWITFNPTSELPGTGTGTGGDSTFDIGDFGVVDPGLADIFAGGELIAPGQAAGGVTGALEEEPVDNQQRPWWILWLAMGLAVVAVALAGGGWFAWAWDLRGLDGRIGLWGRTQKLARWARFPVRDDETPSEWSRRLGTAIDAPDEAATLARAYQEERYGPPGRRAIPDDDAESAYRTLRSALIARILRRKRRRKETPDA